jgi:hypothetical protein
MQLTPLQIGTLLRPFRVMRVGIYHDQPHYEVFKITATLLEKNGAQSDD